MLSNDNNTDNQRDIIGQEIVHLINQYLNVCNKSDLLREDLADVVYELLSDGNHITNLHTYPRASAAALHTFIAFDEVRKQMTLMMGDDFDHFCGMLRYIIVMCGSICLSEANMARLDRAKWEIGYTDYISIEEALNEKSKYEYKLKHLNG